MKRVIISVLSCALLTGTATLSFAADDKEGKIKQRKENQQKRIAKGVENGSLTPREAARIERQESKINKGKYARIAKRNGGNLTNKEKAKVIASRTASARKSTTRSTTIRLRNRPFPPFGAVHRPRSAIGRIPCGAPRRS
jgi:hypothetical protein